MVRGVPAAAISATAGQVRVLLSGGPPPAHGVLLALAEDGGLAGVAPLTDVLLAPADRRLATIVRRDWPTVPPELDQERAAELASRSDHTPLVVVGDKGEPLGIIPDARLLGVMAREHREDVHRIVGIMRNHEGARHALDDPPLGRVGRRLPWLLVGLLLSTVGTVMMASFEAALKANVAIAFFIPAVVYLTDAIGTQTEAIAVRGLSLEHRPLPSILAGEIVTGAVIGLVLGVLSFIGVALAYGSFKLALGVGISLFIAGTLASGLGLLLPWLLSRAGLDPAFGSGPVATIIQDVLTILVYFLTMSALVV